MWGDTVDAFHRGAAAVRRRGDGEGEQRARREGTACDPDVRERQLHQAQVQLTRIARCPAGSLTQVTMLTGEFRLQPPA
ncbi:hypothetical protein GCM10010344_07450 [Streptomyces bluensis]|nr:hypothetical protein GCM10010344_07450 [Streptomyces bluensis]